METVLQGDSELYSIMKEKEEIYMKADFTIEDGLKAGELEARFEEKNGWHRQNRRVRPSA